MGIYATLLDPHGVIDPDRWQRAIENVEMVGTCTGCRSVLRPEKPRTERITWFTATCVGCRREVTAPGGRLLPQARRPYSVRH